MTKIRGLGPRQWFVLQIVLSTGDYPGHFWQPSAEAFRVCASLERRGLATSREYTSDGLTRREYAITDAGRHALALRARRAVR